MKRYFIILISTLFLFSCTLEQSTQNMQISPTPLVVKNIETSFSGSTGDIIPVNTGALGTYSGIMVSGIISLHTSPNSGSLNTFSGASLSSSGGIIMLPGNHADSKTGTGLYNTGELTIEMIRSLKTLDELLLINPFLLNNSLDVKNENFFEIEKNKLILGYYLSRIVSTEYKSLVQEKAEILSGKAVWTPEIEKVETDFQNSLEKLTQSGGMIIGMNIGIEKERTEVITKFQESKKYLEYIKTKQARINEIDTLINNMLDPEAQAAKKEITRLTSN